MPGSKVFSAYRLIHQAGKGNFMVMAGGNKALRYDDENIYIWDKALHCEVRIGRAELNGLLVDPRLTAVAHFG